MEMRITSITSASSPELVEILTGQDLAWTMPSTARDRIEAELRSDPARSDHLISEIIGCHWHRVGAVRHRLEDAGEIPVIPVAHRAVDAARTEIQRGRLKVTDRPSGSYYRIDEIETSGCCIQEWSNGSWVHARA